MTKEITWSSVYDPRRALIWKTEPITQKDLDSYELRIRLFHWNISLTYKIYNYIQLWIQQPSFI